MRQKTYQSFKTISLNIIIGTLLTFLYSCEEKIDLKLDSTYNRIVVDGEIRSEQQPQKVRLTLSTNYLYNESAPAAKGATVIISDDQGNVYPLTETPTNSGIYLTAPDVKGIPGRTYKLKISNIDINGDGKEETYEASSLMKVAMKIDSISFEKIESKNKKNRYAVNGWGQEPETPGDYYMWKYYRNGHLETDTLKKTIFTDDAIVNGNYIPGLTMFEIEANQGDTIEVETIATTKEYYEFVISMMLETAWTSGSFGGPPANIKTNISNGGLGYFNAIDVKRTKNVIP